MFATSSFYLQQLSHLAGLGAVAWGAGWCLLPRPATPRWWDDLEAMGIGLLLLAQLCLALAFGGLLTAETVVIAGLATLAVGAHRRRLERGSFSTRRWWSDRVAGHERGLTSDGARDWARDPAGHPADVCAGEHAGDPGSGRLPTTTPPPAGRAQPQAARDDRQHEHPLARRAQGLGVLLVLVSAGLWFRLALYPPVAYDETTYHLPFAAAFAESAALVPVPSLRVPVFPALAEALFAACLLLADDLAAHLVSLLACWATAVLAAHAAARAGNAAGPGAVGPGAATPAEPGHLAGLMAASLVVASPVTVYLASTAYLEPLLAFATLLTVSCLERERTAAGRNAGAPSERLRWSLLAGLAAGSAAVLLATRLGARRHLAVAVVLLSTVAALLCVVSRRAPGPAAEHTGGPCALPRPRDPGTRAAHALPRERARQRADLRRRAGRRAAAPCGRRALSRRSGGAQQPNSSDPGGWQPAATRSCPATAGRRRRPFRAPAAARDTGPALRDVGRTWRGPRPAPTR